MKVKQRLLFSHLLISLLGIVLVFIGTKGLKDIKDDIDRVQNETIPVKNELANLQLFLDDIVIDTNNILYLKYSIESNRVSANEEFVFRSNDEILAKQLKDWKSDVNSFDQSLREYERLVLKYFQKEKGYLQQIKQSSQTILQISENMVNAAPESLDFSRIFLYSQQLDETHQQFRQDLQAAQHHEDIELAERNEVLAQTIKRYRNIMLSLSIGGFLLAGSIAYFFSRCTLKSIAQLQKATIELGKGNLDVRIDDSNRDELGELSQAFDQMAEELQYAIAYTLNICDSLTESLIVLNPASVIQSVNQATCQLLGYAPEALIGQLGPSIFADSDTMLQALTFEQLNISGSITNLETTYRTNNGDKICVLFSASILRDKNGDPLGIIYLAQDITDLKQAQERNTLLANALEHVADAIEITDHTAKYLYVNAGFEKMTGYTAQEVIDQTPATFFRSGKHDPDFYQQMFATVSSGQIWNGSVISKRKNGTLYDQEVTLSPIHNRDGELTNIVAVKRDISDRLAIERIKDEFISIVSHELRTPLASIHGGLNLLSSGLMDPQSQKGRRVIEIASENADRLVLLVNDILELERLESGKFKMQMQPCEATDLILKAINLHQMMANRSGITVQFEANESITLIADPDRIIQVLTNLLSNAIKFSDWGSTISITVELTAADNCVLFRVEDQGRGIPRDQVDNIFERFHQVEASDSRKKGGTGLGLAICRSIVQQLGGQIWVKSVLNQGSCFYFTLPIHRGEKNNET